MRVMDILRENEDGGAGSGGGAGGIPPVTANDVEFFKAEAKKAFDARDKVKAELRAAQENGRLLSDEQIARYKALEDAAAKAEEDRRKKAGEFDSLRVELLKKHEAELASERQRVSETTQRFHDTLKNHAFASAGEWFGGSDSKTILTPAIAAAYFGRYVAVESDDSGADHVVVKGPDGHVILDTKTGRPAAFSKAIGELIGMLDDKDSILRGSGKTGSGSSGGTGGTDRGGDVDVRRPMTAAELRDPNVRAKLKQQMANAGGLQVAAGLNRR